jgi:hypothetical protein
LKINPPILENPANRSQSFSSFNDSENNKNKSWESRNSSLVNSHPTKTCTIIDKSDPTPLKTGTINQNETAYSPFRTFFDGSFECTRTPNWNG